MGSERRDVRGEYSKGFAFTNSTLNPHIRLPTSHFLIEWGVKVARVKKVPLRKCVGCQEMKAKRELIRVVRTPEGNIELDLTGKRAGRGAYICPNARCFDAAVHARRLAKALQCNIGQEVLLRVREAIEGRELGIQTAGPGAKSP